MPESDASLKPETLPPEQTSSEQPTREVSRDGVHYVLLGTAHVSRASVVAVTEMAGTGTFDAIAVELCPARHQALTKQQQWKEMDLYRIIREKKAGLVMANLALGAYQRRIAEQFGI
jgi:pheromone shutdown protein TraB